MRNVIIISYLKTFMSAFTIFLKLVFHTNKKVYKINILYRMSNLTTLVTGLIQKFLSGFETFEDGLDLCGSSLYCGILQVNI